MNRMLFSKITKLISRSRLQNTPIPGSFIQHANYVPSSARSFYTSQPLGVALPEKSTNDYVKVWISEKLVSACLIPIIPWAIMYPSKVGDSLLATLIGVHVFIGLGVMQHDYIRPEVYGRFLTNVSKAIVCLVTFAVLGGFFYIMQHDIGLANIIRRLWAIKGGSKSSPPLVIPTSNDDPSSAMDIMEEFSRRHRCCY